MGSSPSAPSVPTAGENLEDSINAMVKNQGSLREMELFNQLGNIEMIRRVAPAFANVLLNFEDEYGSQMRASESNATAETRAGDIYNLNQLGPAFQQAVDASSDPRAQAIRDELGSQVFGELQAGQGLSPELQREIEQGVRKGQTARGISRGTSAVASEAFARGSAGLQLQQQRMQNADNFLRQTAATRPDAISFITDRQGVQQANPALAPQTTPNMLGSVYSDAQNSANLQSQLSYNASQAGGNGSGIGSAIGMGLGALLAPATGGTSMLATSAMLGGGIGGGLGSMF